MTRPFPVALVVLGLCFALGVEAQEALRVLTYNVQFLPGLAAAKNERRNPDYRAKRIGEEIAKFDIVALEEVFEEKYREKILDEVRKAWGENVYTVVSPKPEGRYNGGCMIVSRLPILVSDAVVFEHFSKPEDFGLRADGFAAKGVIHARVSRGKEGSTDFVDVFATHLEARDDSLRPEQYKEMAAFVRRVSDPGHPVLLLGDFNTRGMKEYRDDPASQYTQLLRALQEARPGGVVDVWPSLRGEALGGTTEQESEEIGKRIDYVFLGNPRVAGPRLLAKSIAVHLFQDPEVVALSDHNAVGVEFMWEGKD